MLKKITFFTIHQAPHNTFIFQGLIEHFNLEVFYLNEKHKSYNWYKRDFYFPGSYNNSILKYISSALKADLSIISAWQSKKYLILIFFLKLFNKNFAIYTDLDISTLKNYACIKRFILKTTPNILVTGIYAQIFLRRYLKHKNVYNFPYGVKANNNLLVSSNNSIRQNELLNNKKIIVFISNRFIIRKGYDMVIKLLQDLVINKINTNFHFRIAGNGQNYDSIKKAIGIINIECDFLNYIEYENYVDEMLKCDIYLQCSEYEPYGIPPIDAFLNRKIIVATSKIYSIYDIYSLNGKVYEFQYQDSLKLLSYFIHFNINKHNLYNFNFQDNRNKYLFEENNSYLFQKIHLNTLKSIT
jgi:hypothetical protein